MHDEPRAEWEALKSREAGRIESELSHPVVEFRQPAEGEVDRLEQSDESREPWPGRE